MITITDAAKEKLLGLIATKEPGDYAIWVAIKNRSPVGFEYDMRVVKESDKGESDVLSGDAELPVLIDGESVDDLKDATIDFVPMVGGFKIDNPNPAWSWPDPLAQAVQDVITSEINPRIAAHGGYVQLLDVKDNNAYIQMGGGCVGCGLVDVTLKQGVEVMIKEAIPQIEKVIDATDHASGSNPYYQEAKGGQAPDSPLA